jgi:hypothetical protein
MKLFWQLPLRHLITLVKLACGVAIGIALIIIDMIDFHRGSIAQSWRGGSHSVTYLAKSPVMFSILFVIMMLIGLLLAVGCSLLLVFYTVGLSESGSQTGSSKQEL